MYDFVAWLWAGRQIVQGPVDQMIAPWLIPVIAAGVQAVGSYVAKKGEEKKAKEQNRAAVAQESAKEEAARRAWDANEQMRIARLRGLMELAAQRGVTIPVDPGMLQPRPFPGLGAAGAAGQVDPGKGSTSAAVGGLFGGLGRAGLAFGASQQREGEAKERQAALRRFLCSIGVKTECDDEGGVGGFRTPFQPQNIPGLGLPPGA